MALVVPFGQYFPGDSRIHNLDARMKLLVVATYVFALFMVSGWVGLALCTLILVACFGVAGIPARLAVRGLMPILFILVFTFLANSFTFSALPAGEAPLAPNTGPFAIPESIAWIGSFGIKPMGMIRGLYFVLRIVLLVAATSLLTFTTSVVAISDALVLLMRPLAKLKVPTEDIATMFSIALRFIPVTAEEADKIVVAQSARGAVFDKGGPIKRARAWVPVMVPLFVSLFRRADELACAMETRCYIGQGRSHLRVIRMGETDLAIGGFSAFALILLGVLL
jgi:energy-coupling factor transport system permease protein